MKELRKYLDELIKKGKLSKAIDRLWNILLLFEEHAEKDGVKFDFNLRELKNQIILINSSVDDSKRKERLGIINNAEYQGIKSKKSNAFLESLNELDEFNEFNSFLNKKQFDNLIQTIIKSENGNLAYPIKKIEKSNKSTNRLQKLSLFFSILTLFGLSYLLAESYFPQKIEKYTQYIPSTGTGTNISPWINTNIHVKEGDEMMISASGAVNLAIHHMIDSAKEDGEPLYNWNNPDGTPPPNKSDEDHKLRNNLRFVPTKGWGMLLGYICETTRPNESPMDEAECINNEWKFKKEIISINSAYSGIAKNDGFLWLTVNDVWVDKKWFSEVNKKIDSIHAKILFPEELYPDYMEKFEKLDYLDYSHVWFDDNSGGFLVNIEIRRK